jgi:P4 family phage/plasmid primase-like protien
MTVIDMMARKRELGAPSLPDTAHETIQRYVMERIEKDVGGVLYAEGQWWRIGSLGAWVSMEEERIWTEVQALNGLETLEGANGTKPGKAIRVTSGVCESVCALARARFIDRDFFVGATPGFCSPAGLWTYTPDGWSARRALPADRVRLWVEVDPDMSAEPQEWLAALARIWTDPDPEPEDVPDLDQRVAFIHEWLAAVLLGEATKHQIAPILVGDGDNGKSVIIDVLKAAVPAKLRCSVTPHDLEASRFAAAGLVGKAMNCVAEIPGTELLSSAKIKAIIDGSEQAAERKHKDPFQFMPRAGHIFSANALPPSRDKSHGFWRRWVPLTSPGPKITAAEKRRDFAEEIIAAELPAIIGLAMRAHEARGRKGMTIPPSALLERERWKAESDNVQQWAEERCETSPTASTAFSALYSDYRRWCGENGCSPSASRGFGNRLTALGHPPCSRTKADKRRPLTIRLGG